MQNNENFENIENQETTENKKNKTSTKKVLIITISAILAIALIVGGVLLALSLTKDKPAAETPAEIVKNGEAKYTIVYPNACSDGLFQAISGFVTTVKHTTGVDIDFIKASMATDPDASYILIGNTGFEESYAAVETLAGNEDAYTIQKAGKHIVFTGHFDAASASAVNYFTNNLLKNNYDSETKTLTLKEYSFDGTVALPAAFERINLSLYTIVYPSNDSGAKATAEKIQKRIETTTGKSLKVAKDTIAESAYEILVGQTNRLLSKKCYKDGTRLMEYKFVVEKGQLQIVCGGLYSAKHGGYELANMMMDKNLSLPTGTHAETDITTESVPHTAGTDVRIMTANILSYGQISSQNMDYPISEERAEILAKILVDYTPDFVGIQEMDSGFHGPINKLLEAIKETYGIEYSIILAKAKGATNHSPIIYRSDKYKCDYQNFTTMSYAPNPSKQKPANELEYGSGISSAKFTSLEDPTKEIAILSAHWHWEKEIASGTDNQYYDAKEMEAVIKNLEEMFPNARIFSTGDFNSHRYSGKYLKIFLENTNGEIASTIANKNGVLKPSFQHMGQYIDHIIGKKGTFDVLLHAGTKNGSKVLTDHQPVFADIKFTK